MKKILVGLVLLGLYAQFAYTQTNAQQPTNTMRGVGAVVQQELQAAMAELDRTRISLDEIAKSKEPVKLPASYRVRIDISVNSYALGSRGKFDSVKGEESTSMKYVSSRLETEEFELVFVQYPEGLAATKVRSDLEKRGLRPADISELVAFSRQYTNRSGVFWVETPLQCTEKPFEHCGAAAVINDGGKRELHISTTMVVFPQPFYWIAGVRK